MIYTYIYIYIYIDTHTYIYIEGEGGEGDLCLKYLLLERLQRFYSSLIKVQAMFSMSDLQLIFQNWRTSAISTCY